jgi:hypothetical protein
VYQEKSGNPALLGKPKRVVRMRISEPIFLLSDAQHRTHSSPTKKSRNDFLAFWHNKNEFHSHHLTHALTGFDLTTQNTAAKLTALVFKKITYRKLAKNSDRNNVPKFSLMAFDAIT